MDNTQDKENKENCNLDMGRGCEFCECGDETRAEVREGCFKLHVTDWLKDYPDNLPGDIFEVRFKNTRRGYYQNINNLPLHEGDIVAVEASPGHDIGIVSLSGDMVARQMKRVGFNPQNGEFKKIYRKAKPYDIEKWQEAIALEHETMIKARQIAAEMNLNMKIGDVEYQGDKIKAIFYYIADERVDFRELIKVFAEVFRIRVEMKQIGARQEAGRIGGLGSCGRELCCASWISSFLSVTTNAARTQDISLNPQKLAGQCSKLKCCLIYEYDDYMDARREFPRVNEPLRTLDGEYFFVKNDILARTMSFSTAPGSMAGLVTLPIARVREILKLNAKGVKPDTIEGNTGTVKKEADPGFVNVIGEDSITRFDNTRKKKRNRNGKNRDNGAEKAAQSRTGENDNNRPANEERRDSGEKNRRNDNRPQRNSRPERRGEERPDSTAQGNAVRRKSERSDKERAAEGMQENRPAAGQEGRRQRPDNRERQNRQPAERRSESGEGTQAAAGQERRNTDDMKPENGTRNNRRNDNRPQRNPRPERRNDENDRNRQTAQNGNISKPERADRPERSKDDTANGAPRENMRRDNADGREQRNRRNQERRPRGNDNEPSGNTPAQRKSENGNE